MAGWTNIRAATRDDWPRIAALLTEAALPLAGAEEHLGGFSLALRGDMLLGCAALERYGRDGLLRSVAVAAEARGQGLGGALVQALVERARHEGLQTITLLTTTAAAFFPRFGFRAIAREEAPPAVQDSIEFREACPASATVLLLDLAPVGDPQPQPTG
jgi:N-acetylglutamate synthase-like GNAT family acetyltransferase